MLEQPQLSYPVQKHCLTRWPRRFVGAEVVVVVSVGPLPLLCVWLVVVAVVRAVKKKEVVVVRVVE